MPDPCTYRIHFRILLIYKIDGRGLWRSRIQRKDIGSSLGIGFDADRSPSDHIPREDFNK